MLINGRVHDRSGALLSPGGSLANVTGLKLAINRALGRHLSQVDNLAGPGSDIAQLTFYVSGQAHYSFDKAVDLLGLGRGQLRKIPHDELYRIDLAALENGGRALSCSDEHYGSMHNLVVAGRGVNMGDGWETARRRGPGNDWVILALGHAGTIECAEIDTAHFKGNYTDRVSLEAAVFEQHADAVNESDAWQTLLPESKLDMDKLHTFEDELADIGAVTHVRMSIYPDGGISRLRLFGSLTR